MTLNKNQAGLITNNKFDVRYVQTSGLFGFKKGHYDVLFEDKKIGGLSDDPALAQLCKQFLNAAHHLGASSGMAQASVYGEEAKTCAPPNPYVATVYKGKEDYDFSIEFEESPIQHLKNISAQALNNMIDAFNYAYRSGFNDGVDSVLALPTENSPNINT